MVTLATKPKGKLVDVDHVREKVNRDSGRKLSEGEVKDLLDSLKDRELIDEREGEYAIAKKGREWFEERWREVEEDLNWSYLLTYRAKRYYPHVVDALLGFCEGRRVSVFRIYTDRSWLQRKLGKKYITLESEADVRKWLNLHGIDFIPYLCRKGEDRPEWFVVDLDAGEKVSFEKTKKITEVTFEILKNFGIEPAIKFSGSRGFQIWTKFKSHDLPSDYEPFELKTKKRKRNFFSFYSDLVRYLEGEVGREVPELTTSKVADKEARKDKVLLDPSLYKPFGDVRAPYSIHYKTGLVSMPLSIDVIGDFERGDASPERVAERYEEKGNEFELEEADGSEFFQVAMARSEKGVSR